MLAVTSSTGVGLPRRNISRCARSLPAGRILELACGTGIWTERLAVYSRDIVAGDAAPEAIATNRQRLRTASERVRYVQADLFTWEPDERFDVVSFGPGALGYGCGAADAALG